MAAGGKGAARAGKMGFGRRAIYITETCNELEGKVIHNFHRVFHNPVENMRTNHDFAQILHGTEKRGRENKRSKGLHNKNRGKKTGGNGLPATIRTRQAARHAERYPHMERLRRPMCGYEKNFAGGRSAAIIPGQSPGWRRHSRRRGLRIPRFRAGTKARSLRRSSSSGRTRLALGSGRIMGAIPAPCPEWRRR